MATYSNNTTQKISANSSRQTTSSVNTTLTYTVSSGEFAVVTITLQHGTGSVGFIRVDGIDLLTAGLVSSTNYFYSSIYLYSGSVVTVRTSSSGTNVSVLSAISFVNTP